MFRSAASSVLALCLGAAPVFAEVTPSQVWEDLQKTYASYGYEVTGTAEDAGGTLTVRDAVFAMPAEGGRTAITVPQITFQETGDAKVRVSVEGDVAIDSTFQVPAPVEDAPGATDGAETAPPEPATPEMVDMTATGTIKAPGNEILVSGTPEDMLYEFTYPSLVADIQMPVGPEVEGSIPLNVTLTGVSGTQRNTAGTGKQTALDMKAAEARMSIVSDIPAQADGTGGGKIDLQATLTDLTGAGTGTMPAETFDLNTQMGQALAAGLAFDGTLGFQALEGSFDFAGKDEEGQDQTGQGTFGTGPVSMAAQMSAEGLGVTNEAADAKAEMTLGTLPFPVSYAVERAVSEFRIPLTKAEAAQPFKLVYALQGLTFADGIWNMFDPNSQLPRDPASLNVDLSGTAVVTQDLFDPALQAPDAAPPMRPETLSVNTVALDAVGAKVDFSGDLTFGENPNEPVGTLNGTLTGVNGLLDKLVAMGLVPQDQMMGMRMMLTMFAKPAEGQADQLTSTIEFREGGSIFANGQQIK